MWSVQEVPGVTCEYHSGGECGCNVNGFMIKHSPNAKTKQELAAEVLALRDQVRALECVAGVAEAIQDADSGGVCVLCGSKVS